MRFPEFVVLLAVNMVACGGSVHRDSVTLSRDFLWIEEPPTQLFHPRQITTSRVVFEWRFETPGDLAPWTIVNAGGDPTLLSGALVVPGRGKRPRLIRTLNAPAATADEIEVDAGGATAGRLRLFWRAPGESFTAHRSLTLQAERAPEGAISTYRFSVASHSLWKGDIGQLRLDLPILPDGEAEVRAVRGLDLEVQPDKVAAAAGRAWQVDLGSEVRTSLLAPPGLLLQRELEVPRDALLRFAFGGAAALGQEVRFQVLAAEAEGEDPSLLFEEQVRVDDLDGNEERWRDATVSLEAFAGRRIRLILRTETTGLPDLALGVPAFANPHIVWRGQRRPRPNLLLIVIDTLRADHLSLYGHSRETSPRLDAWARRHGVAFANTVAPAPWTLPSHLSIFTGLDTLAHGRNHDLPVPPSFTTLAEVLRKAGYETRAVTGGAYLHPRFGLAQGFDRYRYWPADRDPGEELEAGVATALEWLEHAAAEGPFFLFFHTYEVHKPFHARLPFIRRFPRADEAIAFEPRLKSGNAPPRGPGDLLLRKTYSVAPPGGGGRAEHDPLQPAQRELVEALYDSGIAYTDDQVGRILRRLEELGLASETVVVITSDHGEALGERDLAAHAYLWDFNLMVPLIFTFPDGLGRGETIPQQVRSVDILPTVLEALGVEVPGPIDGVSLRPLILGRGQPPSEAWSYAASSNYGISLRVANRLKYIYRNAAWAPLHAQEEIYRLDRDPGETTDVAAETASWAHLRRRVMERYRQEGKGLRLHFVNRSSQAYEVVADNPALLRLATVKAADLRGPRARWLGSGRAVFDVPPSSDFVVFLERLIAGQLLGLEIRSGTRPAMELNVPVGEPGALPLILALQDGQWRTLLGGEGSVGAPEALVEISEVGGGAGDDDEIALNPQLLEQLRALGYVN